MEAVPRMPMLAFELKHSPEFVEFGPTLKQYIRDHYGEDPAHYNKSCNELEQLRQSAVHVSHDFMGCSTLKKYFSQLQFLQGRFPMTELGEAAIPFTWEDVYSGREITLNDIKFEQACILYNIGALHSVLGAMDTRQSADGMKVSCTHFQCASWAFEYLRDHFGSAGMSMDMAHELLTYQVNLMLAQAQECILEKSMTDSRKSMITAKVSAQIVEFYRTSLKHLDTCNTQELISSKQHKEWKKRIDIKILFYTCITNFYLGRQSEDQQKWGQCLAYYTLSLNKLGECQKCAKSESSDIQESLRFTNDVVGGKHQAAKKDNDFVYHEKIPDLDSLAEVKGASLVKGIPFNPNDPEISGPDIFVKLVPMSAHEASSLYSEEKATLLRRIRSEIAEKNDELSKYLSSLQLDQTKLNPEPERLPQQLLEKCAAISVRPNAIKDLVDSMAAVSNVSTEVDCGIKEVQQLLQEESTAELEYQDKFGKRAPNIILSEIAKECAMFEEGHKKGSQSNTDLHKAMNTHINNLKLLSSPLQDLQKLLPSLDKEQDPESADVIKELNMLLGKVEEMRTQRESQEEDLRKEILEDDITSALCKQEGVNRDVLFSEQLKKHDKRTALIKQNLAAQNNILRALTDSNAKYATVRQATSDIIMKRDQVIRDLINSYDVYEDLMAKSQKGLEFYKKLETNVGRLLSRCKGVCKVQEEEREQVYNRYKPKAPTPTRPVAPKPARPGIDGHDDIPVGIPHPSSGALPRQPAGALPQPPSGAAPAPTVSAMFDGPKLKDYLPFMKPKTFGKKDGSPPISSAHPSVQDYIGQSGSLPNSGTASPVHVPQMPGSVPASPDRFRNRANPRLSQTDGGFSSLPSDLDPGQPQSYSSMPISAGGQDYMPQGRPLQTQQIPSGQQGGGHALDQDMGQIPQSSPQFQTSVSHMARSHMPQGQPAYNQGQGQILSNQRYPSDNQLPSPSQSQYVPLDQKWKKEGGQPAAISSAQPGQGQSFPRSQPSQMMPSSMYQQQTENQSNAMPQSQAQFPDQAYIQTSQGLYKGQQGQGQISGQVPHSRVTQAPVSIQGMHNSPGQMPPQMGAGSTYQAGQTMQQVAHAHSHQHYAQQNLQNISGVPVTPQSLPNMSQRVVTNTVLAVETPVISPGKDDQSNPNVHGHMTYYTQQGQGQEGAIQGQINSPQNVYQGHHQDGGRNQQQNLQQYQQPQATYPQNQSPLQSYSPSQQGQGNVGQQSFGQNLLQNQQPQGQWTAPTPIQGQQTGVSQPQVPTQGQQTGVSQPQLPVQGQQTGVSQPQVPIQGQQTGVSQPQVHVPIQGQQTGVSQPQVPIQGQQTGVSQPQVPVQPANQVQPPVQFQQSSQYSSSTSQQPYLASGNQSHQSQYSPQSVQPQYTPQSGQPQYTTQSGQPQYTPQSGQPQYHHQPVPPNQTPSQTGSQQVPQQGQSQVLPQTGHQQSQQIPQFPQQPSHQFQAQQQQQMLPQHSLVQLQPGTSSVQTQAQMLPQQTTQIYLPQQQPHVQYQSQQQVPSQPGPYQQQSQQTVQPSHSPKPQAPAPQYQQQYTNQQLPANQLPAQNISQPLPTQQQHQQPQQQQPQQQQPQQQHQQQVPPKHSSPVHSSFVPASVQAGPRFSAPGQPVLPQTSVSSQQMTYGVQQLSNSQSQAMGIVAGQGYNSPVGGMQNIGSQNFAPISQSQSQGQYGVGQGQSGTQFPNAGQFNVMPMSLQQPQQQQVGQTPGTQLQRPQVPPYSQTDTNRQAAQKVVQGQYTSQGQVPQNYQGQQIQQNFQTRQVIAQGQQSNFPNPSQGVDQKTQQYASQFHGHTVGQGQFQNQGQYMQVTSTPQGQVHHQPTQPNVSQQMYAEGQGLVMQPQVVHPSLAICSKDQGQSNTQSQSQSSTQPLTPATPQSDKKTVTQTVPVIPANQVTPQGKGSPVAQRFNQTGQMSGGYNPDAGQADSPAAVLPTGHVAGHSRQGSESSHPADFKSSVVDKQVSQTDATIATNRSLPGDRPTQTFSTSKSISMDRQLSTASSLDDILSSSPDAKVERSESVLSPKVLTAQEIQQQKEDQLKNSHSASHTKDPYKDRSKLDKFVAEVEKLAKVIEGFEKPTCSGPTPLDFIWKELMEEQDKAGRKQTLAIARCYPMKNREQDIMPYDISRVLLTSLKDDYINASWVNDLSPLCPKFIAAQSPLPATLIDFWLMVYEQGVEVLVELSSENEVGKKFPAYLPKDKGETIHQGSVQLTLQSIKEKACWTERILHLRHAETKTGRTLIHLHYSSWPISGFPEKISHILQFITEVHSFYRQQRSLMKPIVVHCSNGIGRTGMFLLTYVGMQEVNHGDGIINIQEVAGKLLWKRRNLLLKKDQLKYCFEALLYYAQDVLGKQGILVHKASFGDQLPKPGVKSQSWEPGEDILFGSMSFTNLQSNIAKLGTKMDSSKLDQKLQMLKNAQNLKETEGQDKQEQEISEQQIHVVPLMVGGNSLPDVVQGPGMHNISDKTQEDKNYDKSDLHMLSDLDLTKKQMEGQGLSDLERKVEEMMGSKTSLISTDSGQLDKSKPGSCSNSPAHASREASKSPQRQKQPESLATTLEELQDPSTFTIGTSANAKKKTTKAEFSEQKPATQLDPNDPLSSLDPFWSLK